MATNRFSSGLVIAGAYADKVRRTLFAQTKPMGVKPAEVVRASAELNRVLFEIIVNRLNIDKGDVVRIRIDYDVENGKINWKYDTLEIEAFKRIPDEDVSTKVKDVVSKIKEILTAPVSEEERKMIGADAEKVREEHGQLSVEEIDIGEIKSIGTDMIILKNTEGKTIGVIVRGENFNGIDAIIVESKGGPKKITVEENVDLSNISNVEDVKRILAKGKTIEISKEDAKKFLTEKLKSIM